MALEVPGMTTEEVVELLKMVAITLRPGMESIQRTLIIEACVTALLLLLLVLLTLIPAAHVVLERNARNAQARERLYGFKSSPSQKKCSVDLECGNDDDEDEQVELLNSRKKTKSNELTRMSTL